MSELIRFAHRGAPIKPEHGNTLAAFSTALRNGAQGIESDVRLTADGVPVLVHGPALQRQRSVRSLRRAELPAEIPSLEELWQQCGCNFELALDMAEPSAIVAVIKLAEQYAAVPRLWLTYWRLPTLALWRERWPEVRLVYASLSGFPNALLRRACDRAAAAGVDATNLHHRLLGNQSAAIAHAAGLQLLAWGLRGSGGERRAKRLGVDGIFVDDVRISGS